MDKYQKNRYPNREMTQLNTTTKSRAITGMLWSSGGSFAFQIIRIVTQIILARLLWPEAFGTVALAMAFVTVVNYLIDNGLTLYYIRQNESGDFDNFTLLISNVVLATLSIIFFALLAPLLSQSFGLEIFSSVLIYSSIAILLNALGTVHKASLTREIQFRTQTLYLLISAIVSGLIAVISAMFGIGLWSLVIYNVSYQLILSALLIFGVKLDFKIGFDYKFFRSAFVFSWKLMLSGLIHTLYENTLNVMMANLFSVTVLGYYSNALKIRDGAAQTLSDSIQKVSFPVLSKIKDNQEALKSNSSKILRLSIFIIFPILIGLAASSDAIIRVVFNEQWIGMIPIMQVLAINGLLIPLHKVNLNILTVVGRTDLYLKLEVFKKVIAFSTLGLVLFMQVSLITLLWLLFINAVIGYLANVYYSGNLIDYGFKNQFLDIRNIVLVSVAMGIVVYGFSLLNIHPVWILGIQLLSGVIIYIVLSYKFCRIEYDEVLSLMLKLIKR